MRLDEQLRRWDDDTFAALANRGLLRRAGKDLEAATPVVTAESDAELAVDFAGHRQRFDSRGPAQATCSCPTSGVCQHILAVALWLQKSCNVLASAEVEGTPPAAEPAPTDPDARAQLHAALLGFTPAELAKHAGKSGYRWAWQFVQDLDRERGVRLARGRNIIIGFVRPRVDFHYPGGGLDGLIADAEVGDAAKYRVAAVLAYQRAHGVEIAPPEVTATAGSAALDLGQDHALPETGAHARRDSRTRLRASVHKLLGECVELGLSHLSPAIAERFVTQAVWAQGAEYHRLARSLRRLADHVELLLARAGSADEHRLFEEAALVHALVHALGAAETRGTAPIHLVGRARNRYETMDDLDLLGLGALPWRAASGYVGLTLLFWSPSAKAFLSCTDARPEGQRGFDPVVRYRESGPWHGLATPEQASGRRVRLSDPQASDLGRLSVSDKTNATVEPMAPADFIAQLELADDWSALAQARAFTRRSLLAEPEPLRDWVVLSPAACGMPRFDATRQLLSWPLLDVNNAVLECEIAYSTLSHPAIERLIAMTPEAFVAGTLVVARLRDGGGLVAEPLSLVRAEGKLAVDALYFDAAPLQGLIAKSLGKWRKFTAGAQTQVMPITRADALPPALDALCVFLQRQAERGLGGAVLPAMRAQLETHARRLGDAGLAGFAVDASVSPAEQVLRAHYLQLQMARLLGADGTNEEVAT